MNAWWRVGQAAVAAVWLYQGLWCKLIDGERHRAVVASAPGVGAVADVAVTALGVAEVLLACWVLRGWRPIAAAWAQTLLLVGMNTAGVLMARQHIPDPAGMLIMNAAFLTLAWLVARRPEPA